MTGETTQSPSIWGAALAFDPVPAKGSAVELVASGASGPQTGGALTDPDGVALVWLPAFQYGPHAIDEVRLNGTAVPLSEPLQHTINDAESACDVTQLDTATVTPSTTTTVASTTTTGSTTTTTAASPAGGSAADDEGTDFPWWVLIASGVGLALLGAFFLARSSNPCDQLLAAWLRALADCEAARARAAAADAELEQAAEAGGRGGGAPGPARGVAAADVG